MSMRVSTPGGYSCTDAYVGAPTLCVGALCRALRPVDCRSIRPAATRHVQVYRHARRCRVRPAGQRRDTQQRRHHRRPLGGADAAAFGQRLRGNPRRALSRCSNLYEQYGDWSTDAPPTPNFITVDSILHAYHLFFDFSLRKIETDYLVDACTNWPRRVHITPTSSRPRSPQGRSTTPLAPTPSTSASPEPRKRSAADALCAAHGDGRLHRRNGALSTPWRAQHVAADAQYRPL